MEISYKRTHRESYMVVEKEDGPVDYQERMLKENEIRSLLSFYTMQSDGKTQFWYDISGKQSLRDYVEKEGVSLVVLEKIFACMMWAFEELQKYLIQEQNIILGPEMVYMNRQEQLRMYLCYCPNEATRSKPLFQELMEYVVEKVSNDGEVLVQLCYRLYEMSLHSETTLKEMYDLVEKEVHQQMNDTLIEESAEMIMPVDDTFQTEQISRDQENIYDISLWERVFQQVSKKGQELLEMILGWGRHKEMEVKREDFIIEPVPEVSQPTQLLYQGKRECQGQLVYQGTKQEKDYLIEKESFRIGHGENTNDACLISDAVSHFHAKITKRGAEYYIEDMNSTNGTYVNGEQLCYTQKHKLEPMDRIQFADVSYMFL